MRTARRQHHLLMWQLFQLQLQVAAQLLAEAAASSAASAAASHSCTQQVSVAAAVQVAAEAARRAAEAAAAAATDEPFRSSQAAAPAAILQPPTPQLSRQPLLGSWDVVGAAEASAQHPPAAATPTLRGVAPASRVLDSILAGLRSEYAEDWDRTTSCN